MATKAFINPFRGIVLAATIAAGETGLSDALFLGGNVPRALQMPGTWTAAAVTFQVSSDGTTWRSLYTAAGTEVSATVAADQQVVLDPEQFAGATYLKLRSGTKGTPVDQTASRTVGVVCVPGPGV